jgi:hypothetical protein
MNKDELRRLAEVPIPLKEKGEELVINETAKDAVRHFVYDNKFKTGSVPIKGRLLFQFFLDQKYETARLRGINYAYFINEFLNHIPCWDDTRRMLMLNLEEHPTLKDLDDYAKEKKKEATQKALNQAAKTEEARRKKAIKSQRYLDKQRVKKYKEEKDK